jgi:hyperosmotically inducible periplasmic protein
MTIRRSLLLAAVMLSSVCAGAHAQNSAADTNAASTNAAPAVAASTPTDRQLAANVRQALRAARKQGLKSTYIRVRAHGGVVTLSGVVASESQIAFATKVAQGVSGVRAVQSKLEVRTDVNGLTGGQ